MNILILSFLAADPAEAPQAEAVEAMAVHQMGAVMAADVEDLVAVEVVDLTEEAAAASATVKIKDQPALDSAMWTGAE